MPNVIAVSWAATSSRRPLGRGHEVTLFNRGRTNARLFPDVERLTGDRDGNVEPLRERRWDAVVDTSGYVPRVVRQTAELLRDSGGYVFVSSGSVYPLRSQDRSENGPLDRMDDPSSEDVQAHYGPLKALCEEVVTDTFGERALVVRSGLIAGPFDPTGRFTYWALRVARSGEVLGPGAPSAMCSSSTLATKPPGFWTWLRPAGAARSTSPAPPGRSRSRSC